MEIEYESATMHFMSPGKQVEAKRTTADTLSRSDKVIKNVDPDLPLILSIQEGDDKGLIELMSKYKKPLFHFVLRSLGNEVDATEITEETFVKVYFSAGKYKPRAKVKTWIFTIATNLCKDHFRKKKRAILQSFDAPDSDERTLTLLDRLACDAPSANAAAETNELEEFLNQQIHALPEKLKLPFIHCVLGEMSHSECAEILQTTPKSIETRIYRARKKLKEAMDRNFVPKPLDKEIGDFELGAGHQTGAA